MFKKLLVRFLPVLILLGIVAGAPASTTLACNPCECRDDRRVNCQGIEYYAVYTRDTGGTCSIDAFLINKQGKSRRAFRASARELANLPELPEENTLVKQYYEIALYKLTTGEYQVNAGPDENGKVYVVIFRDCPATNVSEHSYVAEQ